MARYDVVPSRVGEASPPHASRAPHASSLSFSLPDILFLLWHWKMVLLAGLLAGGLIGYVLSANSEPVYTAEGVLLLDPSNDGSNAMRLPSSGVPVDNLVATERDVIRSPALIDAALQSVTEPMPAHQSLLSAMLGGRDGDDRPPDRSDLIEGLRDDLALTASPDSLAVTFAYPSTSPAFAATFVNAMMRSYLDHTITSKSNLQAAHTAKLLERGEEIEKRIVALEETIETLRREPNRGLELQRRIDAIGALVEIQAGFTRDLEALRVQPIRPAAQIVSAAEVPTSPSSPSMPVLVAGSAIVGLMLASGCIIVWAQIRRPGLEPS